MSNAGSSDIVEVLDRSWPNTVADDELRLQWEFLGFLRTTAVNKVAGLTRELAVATPWPTSPTMSLLGVIKHLTAVERFWISIIGGGSDLPVLWDSEDRHLDWRITDQETPASICGVYQAEWRQSEEALAGMAASDPARRRVGEQRYTVRWVLAHVAQETARHVGHLDVLRELADGQVGE